MNHRRLSRTNRIESPALNLRNSKQGPINRCTLYAFPTQSNSSPTETPLQSHNCAAVNTPPQSTVPGNNTNPLPTQSRSTIKHRRANVRNTETKDIGGEISTNSRRRSRMSDDSEVLQRRAAPRLSSTLCPSSTNHSARKFRGIEEHQATHRHSLNTLIDTMSNITTLTITLTRQVTLLREELEEVRKLSPILQYKLEKKFVPLAPKSQIVSVIHPKQAQYPIIMNLGAMQLILLKQHMYVSILLTTLFSSLHKLRTEICQIVNCFGIYRYRWRITAFPSNILLLFWSHFSFYLSEGPQIPQWVQVGNN